VNPAARQAYLQALGLETWVPRSAVPAPATVTPQVAPAAAPRGPLGPHAVPPPAASSEWADLRARVAACVRCSLATTRTQTVFGVGNPAADWMIIGEAPGAEEDRQGEPFVGRAGQLLNAMLHAIGLTRTEVFIANVLKCRPPGNRDPAGPEVVQCLPYLEAQIALVKPKILLVVGRIAAHSLLKTDAPLGTLRRRVHAFGPSRIPLVVTYHPAYLLRTPVDKRKAWEDLRQAREVLARV